MTPGPEVMKIAAALSAHAADRQAVIAANVANANTPGYRASDLPDFASVYRQDTGSDLRQTRPGHMGATSRDAPRSVPRATGGTLSPDGNSVSLEQEMVAADSAKREHDMALAVYRTSLDILRASLGRR